MTELHVRTGSSQVYQADLFLIRDNQILAVKDGEQQIVVDCIDGYWVDAEHGAVDEQVVFTGPNLSEAHVFVDGQHVAKGGRVRMTVGGPDALLRVAGKPIGSYENGSWRRVNQLLKRTKPLTTIVIGPENALELLDQPWQTSLAATPRQRLSPLAV